MLVEHLKRTDDYSEKPDETDYFLWGEDAKIAAMFLEKLITAANQSLVHGYNLERWICYSWQ